MIFDNILVWIKHEEQPALSEKRIIGIIKNNDFLSERRKNR